MMSNINKISQKNESDINDELELYVRLKPYIAHCLNMNHELNNPLAVILGYSEILLDESSSLNDDQKKYLQHIVKGAHKIQECISELSEEKIALNEKINLKEVMKLYNNDIQESD